MEPCPTELYLRQLDEVFLGNPSDGSSRLTTSLPMKLSTSVYLGDPWSTLTASCSEEKLENEEPDTCKDGLSLDERFAWVQCEDIWDLGFTRRWSEGRWSSPRRTARRKEILKSLGNRTFDVDKEPGVTWMISNGRLKRVKQSERLPLPISPNGLSTGSRLVRTETLFPEEGLGKVPSRFIGEEPVLGRPDGYMSKREICMSPSIQPVSGLMDMSDKKPSFLTISTASLNIDSCSFSSTDIQCKSRSREGLLSGYQEEFTSRPTKLQKSGTTSSMKGDENL